jgi:Zn-dependent M28 family amino/carboxypeptidase
MPMAAASSLLSEGGVDLPDLAAAAAAPSFRPMPLELRASLAVSTQVRKYVSHNVIGRLRGTGNTRESVLYLGHWDHLGICRPEASDDKICNGAVDNASGIAMLIEIAANIARGKRPERDLLFMGTTAEEMGLLGAEYFGANPTVPLNSLVAAINIDTVAIHRKGEPVAVIGRGTAPLDALIAETAQQLGRKIDEDKEADDFVSRQDGWVLTRAGVPTVMVGGSFANMKQLGAFLSGPYHKHNDDLGRELILDGAAEDTDLLIALGRKLADPKRYQPPRR